MTASTVRTLQDLTRAELAVLGREYLMAGQLIDRAGMPQVISVSGREPMQEVAIEEWMGASPVYTRRTQQLLGFGGTDVGTMFKGMQFDVGAPHEFLDFRYRVIDDDHGEFWLDHCGALVDVEPMGDDYVLAMCHHIEDPTFEATVCATNPRARMVPIHRPPRVPADRHPHCHWEVEIRHDIDALEMPERAVLIASTEAARMPLAAVAHDPGEEGFTDYARPVDPDLRLEDFSRGTLLAVAQELGLQGHLLVLSFFVAAEQRFGAEVAHDLVARQFTGVAGVVADRLRRALDLGDGPADLATVVELHPAFQPRGYLDVSVVRDADGGVGDVPLVTLGDCPALHETVAESWGAALAAGRCDALDAIVREVNPRARCVEVPAPEGRLRAWELVLGDEERDECSEVTLTRFSTGAAFEFTRVGARS